MNNVNIYLESNLSGTGVVALRYKDNKMNQEYSWIIISGMPTNLLHSKKLFERVQDYLAQI